MLPDFLAVMLYHGCQLLIGLIETDLSNESKLFQTPS